MHSRVRLSKLQLPAHLLPTPLSGLCISAGKEKGSPSLTLSVQMEKAQCQAQHQALPSSLRTGPGWQPGIPQGRSLDSLWHGRGPSATLSQPGYQHKSGSKEASLQRRLGLHGTLWLSLPFPLGDKQMAIPWGPKCAISPRPDNNPVFGGQKSEFITPLNYSTNSSFILWCAQRSNSLC